MKKVGKVITYILIVLLLIGIIGFVFKFTNGGTTDFKTFYLNRGNTLYTADSGNYSFNSGEELSFDVCYLSDILKSDEEAQGYSVKIIPNVTDETKFDYTVDGESYTFAEDLDLSSAFGLEKDKTSFKFTIPAGATMSDILTTAHGKTAVAGNLDLCEKYYFAVVVTSADEKNTVRLNFCLATIPATGIKLSESRIIF